jgi:hydrogenase-4 component B
VSAALLIAAAALWLAAAAVAPAARQSAFVGPVAVLSALGGATCAAGGAVLMVDSKVSSYTAGGNHTVGTLGLRLHPLAGVFLVVLGVIAVAIGLYAPKYHHAGVGTAIYLLAYNLALLASLVVLVAGNVPTFLVSWETMALLCYLLVLRRNQTDSVASGAAFWFLALSEVGFALIVAAFVILATKTGSLDFTTIAARGERLSGGWRWSAYILALVGFGFKAGLVPLHVWLPEAHPVAPSDGSAFLSGLIVKLGVYGIVLFAFDLVPAAPTWCGIVTMALGALSAVLGVLYALTERDLKRFLAFSTIENVGIILTAIGAAMTFDANGQRTLGAFLLLAALYHVASHGVSKALVFLEAGVVDHATGTRDMDRLGGLVRRMPRSAASTLVGVLGLAALPPLSGFVSEWLIFQGMFQAFRIDNHVVAVLVVAAAAILGLTGGLAVAAFLRYFGIPYVGMPRTRQAAAAHESGQPILGGALLAVVTVALGVGAPAVLVALSDAVRTTTGAALRPTLLIGKLTVIPAHTDFSAFSPTYLAVFLVAVTLVPLAIYAAGRPRGRSATVPVWDGGIRDFKPRMQYSAMTFSAPMRVTFSGLYRPTVHLERASDEPAGRSGPVHYETQVAPIFVRYLYQPVVNAVERLADLVRPIQSGNVNAYLFYVFVAVVVAYFVAAL